MPSIEKERCSQCNQVAHLLSSDDPESGEKTAGSKPRFCNTCMIGKTVKVFWPVDGNWYSGTVQEYNPTTGDHKLRYPDGDTEWVKIGDIMQANAAMNSPSPTATNSPLPPSTSPAIADPTPPPPPVPSSSDPNSPVPSGGVASPEQPLPSAGTNSTEERKWPDHQQLGSYPYGGPGYPGGAGGYPPSTSGVYPSATGSGMPIYGMYPGSGAYGMYPPYGSLLRPHPDSSSSRSKLGVSTDSNADVRRKQGPKPWTKEEDTLLVSLVHTMQWPMKWTVVAQSLQDRTGKQCRERYVNHLNPRLKNSDWTPVEDATIFHLYNTIGSHWAKMSKIIPGRTDNGIKNRFHNIRRQYEREDTQRMKLSSVEDFPEEIRLDRLRKFPDHLAGKATDLWDMKSAVGVLAAQSIVGAAASRVTGSRFGPFRPAQPDDICVRCGLVLPSVHTGTEVCTKTGWCQSCTRVPPNVSGNLLRECLNLRREENKELRKIIESWEHQRIPNAENAWPYKKGKTEDNEKSRNKKGQDNDKETPNGETSKTKVDKK